MQMSHAASGKDHCIRYCSQKLLIKNVRAQRSGKQEDLFILRLTSSICEVDRQLSSNL